MQPFTFWDHEQGLGRGTDPSIRTSPKPMKAREAPRAREIFLALAQDSFEPPWSCLARGATRPRILGGGGSACEIECKRLHLKRNSECNERASWCWPLPQCSRSFPDNSGIPLSFVWSINPAGVACAVFGNRIAIGNAAS
jgi:hypothetical protein